MPTIGEALIFRAVRLAAATTALFLAVEARAALAAEPTPLSGSVDAQLFARASNGYSAELKSEGGELQLILSRGIFPALIYTFNGRVSAAGIRAKVADLGTIDLRFKPSGRTKQVEPPRRCSGPRAILSEGHFLGKLRFRAERGVTRIDLAHAKGSVAAPGWHCRPSGIKAELERSPSDVTYTVLQALDKRAQVGFGAFAGTDAAHPVAIGASISAFARTRRGTVRIYHLAVVLATNVFSFDSALTSATVSPPSPFHGSATYCRTCGDSSDWTGDLSVSLPGIGHRLVLTGPNYDASLRSIAGGGSE